MSRPDELVAAAQLLDLDPAGAQLVSASSRLIWHLPVPGVALTISRPGTKTRSDIAAETDAMRAAAAAGVLTPRLRGGPVAVPGDRWAFAADWITGRRPTSADWPSIAAAAARLADAPTVNLRRFMWPDDLNDPRIAGVLGPDLHADLLGRSAAAARTFHELMATAPPVLAHTDLQPANALCNDAGAWLLDLEYAALAPREWDPAKLVILARRVGDPAAAGPLLSLWTDLDPERLSRCVAAEEILLVAWLSRMASTSSDAAIEARHRASTLLDPTAKWRHLNTSVTNDSSHGFSS